MSQYITSTATNNKTNQSEGNLQQELWFCGRLFVWEKKKKKTFPSFDWLKP